MTKLERALLRQIHDPRSGKNRYDSDETLNGLITVAAAVIYAVADDHGLDLATPEDQFMNELQEEIEGYALL